MIEYPPMDHKLKHLALVVDDTLAVPPAMPAAEWILRIVDHFARLASFCLATLPELECLSFFYPELQKSVPGVGRPLDTADFARAMQDAAAAFTEREAGLNLLGFPDLLPPSWAALLGTVGPALPASRSVHFYLGYSGREEIARAADEIINARSGSLDDGDMGSRLLSSAKPDPDLIVFACLDLTPRDFMIWQSSYAEIWHAALPGTECSADEILRALTAYQQRERRFGKV